MKQDVGKGEVEVERDLGGLNELAHECLEVPRRGMDIVSEKTFPALRDSST